MNAPTDKPEKKTIEDAIREILTGERRENALALLGFMRAEGFTFEGFEYGSEAGWNPAYDGKCFGTMKALKIPSGEEYFAVWIGLAADFADIDTADEALKETAFACVVACPQTPCKPPYCQPSPEHPSNTSRNRWKIFGKQYESVCHAPLAFFNPDTKAVDCIKKLLVMIKERGLK